LILVGRAGVEPATNWLKEQAMLRFFLLVQPTAGKNCSDASCIFRHYRTLCINELQKVLRAIVVFLGREKRVIRFLIDPGTLCRHD
jgi:hypothetical protein